VAIRPILEPDIDPDDKLGKYVAKYKEYEAALKKTPEIWNKSSEKAAEATTSFESGLAALLAMLDAAQAVNRTQDEAVEKASDFSRTWEKVSSWSKDFAGNVENATRSLVRWVGLGGIVSGLVGAGGLWGLDELAGGVGARRRQAQGLGLTYGEQRAWEVDLQRVVDPGSFLGGVNEALTDVTKRRYLYSGGLTTSDLRGRDTAQVSVELLKSIKGLVDHTNPNLLGQLLSSRGLGQFGLDVHDLQRLQVIPASELNTYLKQLEADKATFGFDDATQRKWQDLSRALEASKVKIEAAFVDGLSPLVAVLPKLSDAVATSVATFLKSGDLKKWLANFGHGIEIVAQYIGSPKFQTDMKEFATSIGILASKTVAALHWLHIIPDFDAKGNPVPEKKSPLTGWSAFGTLVNPLNVSPSDNADAVGVLRDSVLHWYGGLRHDQYSATTEKAYGLPSGLLENIYGAETDYGRGGMVSPKGALGQFQFMPDTWKQYGKGNPFDLKSSTEAAGKYFRALIDRYHGDIVKAVAAYNWGEGHLDRDIRRYGDAWQSHLPKETRNYVAEVVGGEERHLPRHGTVTHKVKSDVKVVVQVHSTPGSNPIVNASTVGAPQ
jgi:hypothetical protein